jgi:predicted Fe-Mo cluster-binding NifX family protein
MKLERHAEKGVSNVIVAVPVWQGRVSPVFDTARKLLLAEVEDGKVTNRTEAELRQEALPKRAGEVKDLGVNVLICGAISRPLAAMLAGRGIEVLPFVTGTTGESLDAWRAGRLPGPGLLMPGCGGRRRRCRRGGGRRGRPQGS